MQLELLIKSLILLISEYNHKQRLESTELVKSILDKLENSNKPKTFTDDAIIMDKLKALLKSIINGDVTPTEDIMLTIEVILNDKPALLNIINKYTNKKNPEIIIRILLKELSTQVKRISVKHLLASALQRVLSPTTDVELVMEDLVSKIEEIRTIRNYISTGLVDEVDFSDENSVRKAAESATALISGSIALRTGWPCFDKMSQGGLRRGEFVTIAAGQHNYKSSLLKSLFLQIARLNVPVLTDTNKKPLLVFVSVEEEINNIMFFFYAYLKYSLEGISISPKNKKKLNATDVTSYVLKHLNLEGAYEIKIYRFRPELLTYSVLFDLVDRLERQGYEIHGLFLDYASKMNKDGCVKGGATGDDLLDLFSRLRNEFSAKKILFCTPHQLSTEARRLLKNGIPPEEFVKHVANKGYYKGSSALDTEIDLEIFIHKVVKRNKAFLTIQRGKHRIPTQVPPEEQYFQLEFTDKYAPIPESNELHDPCIKPNDDDDEFNF